MILKLLRQTLVFSFLFISFSLSAERAKASNKLIIADFESEEVSKYFDTWEYNILDSSQSIKAEVVEEKTGKVLKLDFDVNSPRSAMVGAWIELPSKDLSKFSVLHLSLKFKGEEMFGGSIAVQFTDSLKRKAPYLIKGVPSEWKDYKIPFSKFSKIQDWSEARELEIIIDDINARPKEGTLFVDEIYVSNS